MVSLRGGALTVGRSLSQWADTIRIALGRSDSRSGRCVRKRRAAVSSIASMGEPWETKIAGSMPPRWRCTGNRSSPACSDLALHVLADREDGQEEAEEAERMHGRGPVDR